MALVAEPPHVGIWLPPKPHTADAFWKDYETTNKGVEVPQHVKEFYNQRLTGGQQSFSDRSIKIYLEGSDESMAIGAKVSTTVQEVKDMLAGLLQLHPEQLTIKRKLASGGRMMKPTEECASSIFVGGVKSFYHKPKEYEHPVLIVGAGLGGIQAMIDFHRKGRTDIICMDRNEDFGGHSWIKVPNRFTKLQTERGTYNVDFIIPEAPVPKMVGEKPYHTWPPRDLLLAMLREGAKQHGLYEHTMFKTHIEKVTPRAGSYAIQHLPINEEDGDAGIMMVDAVSCWPGFLHIANQVEFPGEDDYGGYIEYSSFDKVDYTKTTGKLVVMYGHGAFTIENVRTLVEHRCQKVTIVCRHRNLSGTKMSSWLVGFSQAMVPGIILLDAFKRMYDLIGYDVWTAYSVKTDQEKSFAQIEQKTIFGVTDVYFLAGYYGLMECVVDEIKRCTHHTVHTKNGTKIPSEVIIKAIGTAPSFKVDKEMGIKYVTGFWVNGDPRRPIQCGTKGVMAKNFDSFSVGPGFAPLTKILSWFIEYPDDWWKVADQMPTNKAGQWPAYVTNATYGMPVFMGVQRAIPQLAGQVMEMGALKSRKQAESHPLPEFLGECKAEWEAYIAYFKKHKMVDDRPEPAYPYTEETMYYLMDKAARIHRGEKVKADQ